MDYEKKYNEALEVMRQWIAPCHTKEQLDTLKKSVFPELAESEDERIRKELKEAFEAYDIESKWNGIPIRSIFAWLEKQKEPKHDATDAKSERVIKAASHEDYIKGYANGYKDAEKQYNESVAYHYPTMPQRPLCYEPGGTCTNPHFDCINCPKKTTGGIFTSPNTASCGTSAPSGTYTMGYEPVNNH